MSPPSAGHRSEHFIRASCDTVSVDEQTGIQALEWIARDLLPAPGMRARREYLTTPEGHRATELAIPPCEECSVKVRLENIRHGTLGLFGNFHVATGKVLAPLIRPTRTETDFVDNIDGLIQTAPTATWRIVTDNLNTHVSESLVVYVAEQCGIETDLGVKGRHGILKSMDSRREFLTDSNHRIRFVYTPNIVAGSTRSKSGLGHCEKN